jgi:hypothetical protein
VYKKSKGRIVKRAADCIKKRIKKDNDGEFPYTVNEWEAIEKLASKKGKKYKTSKSAKKHIDTL